MANTDAVGTGMGIIALGLLLMVAGSMGLLFVAPLWVKWALLVFWGVSIIGAGCLFVAAAAQG